MPWCSGAVRREPQRTFESTVRLSIRRESCPASGSGVASLEAKAEDEHLRSRLALCRGSSGGTEGFARMRVRARGWTLLVVVSSALGTLPSLQAMATVANDGAWEQIDFARTGFEPGARVNSITAF